MVEFALVLPLFLLLVLAIIEFAFIIYSQNTIANAAREAVRYGIIRPTDAAGIESTARNRAIALNQASLGVASANVGDTIQVTLTYSVDLLTAPFIEAVGGNPTVDLGTVATMYTEQ